MLYLENSYFLIAVTFAVYVVAQLAYRRTGLTLLNPILVSILVLILMLVVTGVPYEKYSEGGKMIEFWLKPATVALGVPLYKQISAIRKQLVPIIIAELARCVVGLISMVLLPQLSQLTVGRQIC